MKPIAWSFIIICSFSLLLLFGCGSSNESTQQKESTPSTTTQKPADNSGKADQSVTTSKVDTVNVVNVQTNAKPTYETKSLDQNTATTAASMGNFSVQIGAYKTDENANRAASLAKERFGTTVMTISDKTDGLFKVLVGSFSTREDARKFRDDIASKYPGDYNDAWVKENIQK